LFAAGSVTPEGVLDVRMSGVLDWGEAYAYLGVEDPLGKRRLIWGWIYEDDNGYGAFAKGWQGSLGLPRVLSVKVIHGVTDPEYKVMEKGYWDSFKGSDGKHTIRVCRCEIYTS
jgi:beta-fructofuranosidase